MRALGREGGSPCVVVLEDGEEGRLVADVGDALVVQEVQAADEGGGSAEEGDELRLVVWNEADKASLILCYDED